MNILISFLWFILDICIVCFIGWIMVAILSWAPFIPGELKAIIKNIIYFVVFIVCIVLLIYWLVSFAGGAPLSGPFWPQQFHR